MSVYIWTCSASSIILLVFVVRIQSFFSNPFLSPVLLCMAEVVQCLGEIPLVVRLSEWPKCGSEQSISSTTSVVKLNPTELDVHPEAAFAICQLWNLARIHLMMTSCRVDLVWTV